jgi:hypothetical protein
MITFISGKPGDGKSLYATKLILEDLVEDRAYVVTNVPLDPRAVHAYVTAERERRKIETPFAFDDSVRVLDDADVYEFYRRRSGGLVLAPSPDFTAQGDGTKRLERPEFVAKMKEEFGRIRADVAYQRPCHFYVDEAHNFFSAREWANTGRGLLYYASQHRHLHDNVWFITQVVDNVEKQLRGLASELHRVRNNLRRSLGPIKLRPVFKVHKFYGVPSEGALVQPYDVSEMTLDPAKVAGCYRTVGALGVQTKPEKIRNSGVFPWWVVFIVGGVVVLGIVAFFVALPALGMNAAKKMVSSGAGGSAAKFLGAEKIAGAAPGGAEDTPRAASFAPVSVGRAPSSQERSGKPFPVGYVVRGSRALVLMSDGMRITERDVSLQEIDRGAVKLSGVWIPLRPRETANSAARPAPEKPAIAQSAAPLPAQREEGAWVVGPDGVSRLKEPVALGFRGN